MRRRNPSGSGLSRTSCHETITAFVKNHRAVLSFDERQDAAVQHENDELIIKSDDIRFNFTFASLFQHLSSQSGWPNGFEHRASCHIAPRIPPVPTQPSANRESLVNRPIHARWPRQAFAFILSVGLADSCGPSASRGPQGWRSARVGVTPRDVSRRNASHTATRNRDGPDDISRLACGWARCGKRREPVALLRRADDGPDRQRKKPRRIRPLGRHRRGM